jgi:uncharacterized protein GlcG (DUF336 family)
LLLLSGGAPIYYKNNIIGSAYVAGVAQKNDDLLKAKAAEKIPETRQLILK